jgi:hypothetical protein
LGSEGCSSFVRGCYAVTPTVVDSGSKTMLI